MAVILQVKRGVASSWTTNNPILQEGEIGLEKDTNQIKVGNGVTTWNSLAYFGGSTGSSISSGTATGTNSYAVTLVTPLTSLTTFKTIQVKFTNASSGVVTLTPDALASKKVFKNVTTQATTGDILANTIYVLIYDGTLDSAVGGWLIINNTTYVPAGRLVNTTSPLAGGGALTGDLTLTIGNAVADGSTKGAAAFVAADFTAASGVISINYTSGQAATTSLKGFLTSTDWNTFNGKAAVNSQTFTGTPTLPTGTIATTQAINDNTTALATTAFVNRLYTPREQTIASASSVTAAVTDDLVTVTALAAALNMVNPSGSAPQGKVLVYRFKDNATARALTWDTQFRPISFPLPTTTVISKTRYVMFMRNTTDTTWDLLADYLQL